ncbi:uncharacterized protein LOC141911049 [Tubulanus polymorphus]|uniref:uncharacterized protein LOC141906724 n=1 Tax=Tubulanus polymorphus TaxID=672921 RepID=UPI003DA24138
MPPPPKGQHRGGEGCGHLFGAWDNHDSCASCRRKSGQICARSNPCNICVVWSEDLWLRADKALKLRDRRRVSRDSSVSADVPTDVSNPVSYRKAERSPVVQVRSASQLRSPGKNAGSPAPVSGHSPVSGRSPVRPVRPVQTTCSEPSARRGSRERPAPVRSVPVRSGSGIGPVRSGSATGPVQTSSGTKHPVRSSSDSDRRSGDRARSPTRFRRRERNKRARSPSRRSRFDRERDYDRYCRKFRRRSSHRSSTSVSDESDSSSRSRSRSRDRHRSRHDRRDTGKYLTQKDFHVFEEKILNLLSSSQQVAATSTTGKPIPDCPVRSSPAHSVFRNSDSEFLDAAVGSDFNEDPVPEAAIPSGVVPVASNCGLPQTMGASLARNVSPSRSVLSEPAGDMPFRAMISEFFVKHGATRAKPTAAPLVGESMEAYRPPDSDLNVLRESSAVSREWARLDTQLWGECRPGTFSFPPPERGMKSGKYFSSTDPPIGAFRSAYYATPGAVDHSHNCLDADYTLISPDTVTAQSGIRLPKSGLVAMTSILDNLTRVGSFQDMALKVLTGELRETHAAVHAGSDPESVALKLEGMDRIIQSLARSVSHVIPLSVRGQANLVLASRQSVMDSSAKTRLPDMVSNALLRAPLGTSSRLFSGWCAPVSAELRKIREVQAKSNPRTPWKKRSGPTPAAQGSARTQTGPSQTSALSQAASDAGWRTSAQLQQSCQASSGRNSSGSYRGKGKAPKRGSVGGCLQQAATHWSDLFGDGWPSRVVSRGYRLRFLRRPRLMRSPPDMRPKPGQEALISPALKELAEKGAIEPVCNETSPGWFSRIFMVPKATGGQRTVIDLSSLNRHLDIPRFRMTKPKDVIQGLRPGQWAASLDLKDAYFQVPIHPKSRRFLRIKWKGRQFQFRSLPFGLSTAPWVFTKLVKSVQKVLQSRGVRLFVYLDDWLIVANSAQECREAMTSVLDLVHQLGFRVNREKSQLTPAQQFTYLGMDFDLRIGKVFPSMVRVAKLQEAVAGVSTTPRTARYWSRLLGSISSMGLVVPLGRLRSRRLQQYWKVFWSQSKGNWEALIPVPPTDLSPDLQWWAATTNLRLGVSLAPLEAPVRVFTDASHQGWGAHLENRVKAGKWSRYEATNHINFLEMLAVWKALKFFHRRVEGHHVWLATDNSTVRAYLQNQGGTHSETLTGLSAKILLWCQTKGVSLTVAHLAGKRNVMADALSRRGQAIATEWVLHQEVADRVRGIFGNPLLDLFATRFNRRCPLFVSPFPDAEAWGVDAFSLDWSGMHAYAFPPTPVLPRLLDQIERSVNCNIVLVAPCWPAQKWFLPLLNLLCDNPRILPNFPSLLSQGIFRHHPNSQWLNLLAWPLSSDPCQLQAFQNRLPPLSQDLSGHQQVPFTMPSGVILRIGVLQGKLIHAHPL